MALMDLDYKQCISCGSKTFKKEEVFLIAFKAHRNSKENEIACREKQYNYYCSKCNTELDV